jgi:hypothetical protein
MTEAQRLRLLELAVEAGALPSMAVEAAQEFERYCRGESAVVLTKATTGDSPSKIN